MAEIQHEAIIRDFQELVLNETYPCVAARSAMSRKHIPCYVADHIACGRDDKQILEFLYGFILNFRMEKTNFHSAAVIFKAPETITEEIFDTYLWQRLQSLSQLDAVNFPYDQ